MDITVMVFPCWKGVLLYVHAKHGWDGMWTQDKDKQEMFRPKKEVNLYCANTYFLFLLLKKS